MTKETKILRYVLAPPTHHLSIEAHHFFSSSGNNSRHILCLLPFVTLLAYSITQEEILKC